VKNAEAFQTVCKHYINFKTLKTRRIKEILVWFWGFAGNFMRSLQSTYIHINDIMHIVTKEKGPIFNCCLASKGPPDSP